jgi:hypothetical protein
MRFVTQILTCFVVNANRVKTFTVVPSEIATGQ